ncbi:Hypothetical predicted protein [Paramuricea clavata]|uniref:Uncharacterized protein n=1 Tax=Paramuricea clavata TaxID=317549 RepID=A0A7D9DNB1_PARCT|nr:Hypothetical predicted protein [Paramuricea clavata]
MEVTNTLAHSPIQQLSIPPSYCHFGKECNITLEGPQQANVANNAINTEHKYQVRNEVISKLLQVRVNADATNWQETRCKGEDLTIGTRVLLQQWKRLELKDGVLYRTIIDPQEQEVRQLVLPEILKERIIRSLHNDMGHQGLERTILLARSRCYWPGMYTDVEKWIKSCERCVLSKMPQPRIRTPMGHLITEQPLSVLAIDFTLLERSSDGKEMYW